MPLSSTALRNARPSTGSKGARRTSGRRLLSGSLPAPGGIARGRPLRALVIDDDAGARAAIITRLAGFETVEIVGECARGREGVGRIQELRPDVVFLEIEMPDISGFDVLAAIGGEPMPHVVFVTEDDQHAVRAFQANALDYLLKPIDDHRFRQTLEKLMQRTAGQRLGDSGDGLGHGGSSEPGPRLPAPADAPFYVMHFLVKRRNRIVVVPTCDIDWIEAEGDYLRLHCGKESHLIRDTMAAIGSRLDPREFVRIHRSTIVHLDRIRELHPHFNREFVVLLRDGTQLKLSRGYRDSLKAHFGGAL
jgi:two-component system LytT family response regulator